MRTRLKVPVLHDTEHWLQPPQLPTLQSAEHSASLQARTSCRYGQTYPPCRAWAMTERCLTCETPPHDAEHVLQLLNDETTQCSGHWPRLQVCVSLECGHAAPPQEGNGACVRERVSTPLPHEREHVLHGPKTPRPQSMGQQCSLHVIASLPCGQAIPPARGDTIGRLRSAEPPSHDTVHALHDPHSPTTQSSAHSFALHDRVSLPSPAEVPPKRGNVTGRRRCCTPPPHEREHVSHAPQLPTAPSRGHACVLQLIASLACAHAMPPSVGVPCDRLRERMPVPHEYVHVLHAPHADIGQSTGHGCSLHACVSPP